MFQQLSTPNSSTQMSSICKKRMSRRLIANGEGVESLSKCANSSSAKLSMFINSNNVKGIYTKTDEEVKFLEEMFQKDPKWGRKTVQICKKELNLRTDQVYKWGYDRKKLLEKKGITIDSNNHMNSDDVTAGQEKCNPVSETNLEVLVSNIIEGLSQPDEIQSLNSVSQVNALTNNLHREPKSEDPLQSEISGTQLKREITKQNSMAKTTIENCDLRDAHHDTLDDFHLSADHHEKINLKRFNKNELLHLDRGDSFDYFGWNNLHSFDTEEFCIDNVTGCVMESDIFNQL